MTPTKKGTSPDPRRCPHRNVTTSERRRLPHASLLLGLFELAQLVGAQVDGTGVLTLGVNVVTLEFEGTVLVEVLLRDADHQLDAIQLVHLGGTGIVVDGHDVGHGIELSRRRASSR